MTKLSCKTFAFGLPRKATPADAIEKWADIAALIASGPWEAYPINARLSRLPLGCFFPCEQLSLLPGGYLDPKIL